MCSWLPESSQRKQFNVAVANAITGVLNVYREVDAMFRELTAALAAAEPRLVPFTGRKPLVPGAGSKNPEWLLPQELPRVDLCAGRRACSDVTAKVKWAAREPVVHETCGQCRSAARVQLSIVEHWFGAHAPAASVAMRLL